MTELLNRYPSLSECEGEIQQALTMLIDTYKEGGKVLLCGNGGSCADCEHIVGELMKGFLSKREVTDTRIPEDLRPGLQGALPAISLPSQTALMTAFCNDVEPSMVYAQMVSAYAREGDLFLGLSTSGNSKNVVNAARVARALGMRTLALTGRDGGKLNALCDVTVKVPETETYKVQELHLPVYHYLCAEVEKYFFG